MTELRLNEPIEESVDNKLELLKHIGEVQGTIKENISSDYVYAKLGDKDKEAITEMTANSQLAKSYYRYIEYKTKNWSWNKTKSQWELRRITEQQKNKLKKNGEILFDLFMVRPHMTVVLNRNVKDNYLVRLMAGVNEEEPIKEEEKEKDTSILEKAKETFGAKT